MARRTGRCAGSFLLPLLLLAASLLDWNLISLINMIIFFAIRFVAPTAGYHLRVACCMLLPAAQLVVSISHPSWISLPFFVFSCIGLVDWSLTSNFHGLFRWWRLLEIYSVFSILLLYIYQLPVKFPYIVLAFADFIGLFKVSLKSEWPELSSGISLLVYYFMVSNHLFMQHAQCEV
ncbi:Piezo-type mechanosensitive ion channel-like protein [Dichanthelium oligosanthes]|uniref:Piezo-type mechanosensitive ion channel-like protein n=1 Tax=Dichanthelium oligosanthes TaxID=888268 RepID=A0A1E5W432_9POAL|nr:Piezo-type mechanosensitive ion channel-like protein [Dichanthelium oligosanthes]